MKTSLTRILSALLVLSCIVGLLGCEADYSGSSSRRRSSRNDKEQTEKAAEEVTEDHEQEQTREVAEEELPDPGTKKLPAIEIFDMDYAQISKLSWEDEDGTSDNGNGTWCFVAYAQDASFTFVFDGKEGEDTALPMYLTVDDFYMESEVYITSDMQLNQHVEDCSEDVQDNLEVMDGGWNSYDYVEGYYAQMMFIADSDDVDDAYMFCVQFQRGR